MHLVLLLLAPFVAALLLAFGSNKEGQSSSRLGLFLGLGIAALAFPLVLCGGCATEPIAWFRIPGISATVNFQLGSDGLSAWLLQLAAWLTPAAIWASRRAIGDRMREFAIWTFLLQGTIFGSLLATDMVVFFLFFEAMLVPSFVLISGFGGRRRRHASLLFVIFTAVGSAPLMIALYFMAAISHGTSLEMIGARMGLISQFHMLPIGMSVALFLAVVVAFAVKTPLLPLHGWQADTYSEAPAGTVALLSGAMAKVGVYGFIRFVIPFFPAEAQKYAGWFVLAGLVAVIYGALVAMAQSDFKRLMAFSSLGHLGLVVAGVFTFTEGGIKGALILMVAHGLSAGGLFLLLGYLERWAKSRHLDDFGGLAARSPLFSTLLVMLVLAAVGLPGTAGFVGEFLILKALWASFGPGAALLGGLGVILSAAYALRMVQKLLFGKPALPLEGEADLTTGESFAIVPLVLGLIVLGFWPTPVTRAIDMSVYQGWKAKSAVGCKPCPMKSAAMSQCHKPTQESADAAGR
ncbi:MAG: hypothetical protein RL318_1500 [Fibrobacterota bacterium]|jgi:NADH-quinone oxidoreductase subunit M